MNYRLWAVNLIIILYATSFVSGVQEKEQSSRDVVKKSFFARHTKACVASAFLISIVAGVKIAAYFHDKSHNNGQFTGISGLMRDILGHAKWDKMLLVGGGIISQFTFNAVNIQVASICLGIGFLNGLTLGVGGMWAYNKMKHNPQNNQNSSNLANRQS